MSWLHTLQQQQQQQSDADNIKVVVRLRPLFPGELAKNATNVCQVAEDFSSLKVGEGSYSTDSSSAEADYLSSHQHGSGHSAVSTHQP